MKALMKNEDDIIGVCMSLANVQTVKEYQNTQTGYSSVYRQGCMDQAKVILDEMQRSFPEVIFNEFVNKLKRL